MGRYSKLYTQTGQRKREIYQDEIDQIASQMDYYDYLDLFQAWFHREGKRTFELIHINDARDIWFTAERILDSWEKQNPEGE